LTTEDILAIKPTVLSDSQRSSYFEKGYLLVDSIVPKGWIDRLLEVTEQMVEKSRSMTESDAVFDLESNHTAEDPRLRRLSSPADQHPLYWEFASESIIHDIVADLVGPDVKFHHSKLNFKWARGGEEVKWHQDITFWPHTNYSPLTVGTYLHDVDDDQGPLGVVPGSHEGELFNQYNDQNQWVGCLSETDVAKLDLDRVEYLTGPAGSITIHNCRAIHGSGVNQSTIGRPLLLNVYSSADAFPYTHDPLMSSHHGDIVRGQPARYAHHDPRPCLIPPDWSEGYTSIYALQREEGNATGDAK
jgi:hypothetical protein